MFYEEVFIALNKNKEISGRKQDLSDIVLLKRVKKLRVK
jgi:hypothetical protein